MPDVTVSWDEPPKVGGQELGLGQSPLRCTPGPNTPPFFIDSCLLTARSRRTKAEKYRVQLMMTDEILEPLTLLCNISRGGRM